MLCVALSALAHAPASACATPPPAPRQFTLRQPRARSAIRARVEKMGSQNRRIVGESQPVLVVISPMIPPRTRISRPTPAGGGGESVHDVALVHGDALPQALHLPEFHRRVLSRRA
jgi:hypothetical protein